MPNMEVFRFQSPGSALEAPLADRLSRFFALNPTYSLIDLSIRYKADVSRRGVYEVVALMWTGKNALNPTVLAGTKYYAQDFVATASSPLDTQINAFFAADPNRYPVKIILTQLDRQRYTSFARAVVVYTDAVYATEITIPQVVPTVPIVDIPTVLDGLTLNDFDPTRRQVRVVNQSPLTWKAGNPQVAFKTRFYSGLALYNLAGQNLVAAPPVPPVNPPPFVTPVCCVSCWKLLNLQRIDIAPDCANNYGPVIPDYTTIYSGNILDVAKLIVHGSVQVVCPPPVAATCGGLSVFNWNWKDINHFAYVIDTLTDDTVLVAVGYEELAAFCAGYGGYNTATFLLTVQRVACPSNNPAAAIVAPPLPAIDLSIADITVPEDIGNAVMAVTRLDAGPDTPVHVFTTNGTAIDGVDYTGVDFVHTFTALEVLNVTIPIINRAGVQGDRAFNLNAVMVP